MKFQILHLKGCYHVQSVDSIGNKIFVALNRKNVAKAIQDMDMWHNSCATMTKEMLLRFWFYNQPEPETAK